MMNRIEAKANAKSLLRSRSGKDAAVILAILACLQVVPSVISFANPLHPMRVLLYITQLSQGNGIFAAISEFIPGYGEDMFVKLLLGHIWGSIPLAVAVSLPINIIRALANLLFHGGLVRASLRLSGGDESVRAVDTILATDHLGKYVLIALCQALLLTVWSLPSVGLAAAGLACVAGALTSLNISAAFGGEIPWPLMVLAVLLLIAALVWRWCVGIVKPLQYFFSFHACEDDPELGTMECIRESGRLTAGNKGGLFITELSFIGWRLLDVTFFAQIFTIPYRYLTYALLYRQLKEAQGASQYGARNAAGGQTDSAPLLAEAAAQRSPALEFLSGEYAGSQVSAADGGEIRIGRDPAQVHVVIPEHCAQISGLHCGVRYDKFSDCYIVTDYSVNGTYAEGARLPAGSTKVRRGTVIKLAEGAVLFRLA